GLDGTAREAAGELMFPNGMVLDDAGTRFVVAETGAGRLTAFDVASDGALSGRREFASVEGRAPDGICLDAGGAVWVSDFLGGAFVRVAEGGAASAKIDVAGRRAVACMLGGERGTTLYLLSADTDLHRLGRGESRAWVDVVEVEHAHAGRP